MTEDALRRLFDTAAGTQPGAPDPGHLIGRGKRRQRRRRLVSLGTVTAVALGIALPLELPQGSGSGHHGLRLASDLKAFASCDALLTELKDRARPTVGAYGYGNGPVEAYASSSASVPGLAAAPTRAAAAAGTTSLSGTADTAAAAPAASAPLAHSSTTDRTQGVDEPDLLKTDGKHVFVLQHSTLSIYDASDPRLVGSVQLDRNDVDGQDMLLKGNDVVVLGGQPDIQRSSAKHPTTVLRVIDVSDPTHPTVSRILTVDGTVVDARLQGGSTRLVLNVTPPQLQWYQASGGAEAQTEATDANRRLLDATTIADWLPTYGLTDASGKDLDHGTLLGCDQVTAPTAAGTTGTDLLGVATLDPAADRGPAGAVAVIGAGNTIYATDDHLWLATGNQGGWGEPWCFRCFGEPTPTKATVQLHGFDFSDPTHPTYLASAALDGTLHDDYSVDETADGTLRVVTTQSDGTHLDVLSRDGEQMRVVGSVPAFASGEQVQSVRFYGPLAYVVTFKQTDPLQVVDLSNRAKPRLRGTLQLPGFSSYLVSPTPGRLLGLGLEGNVQRAGLKLFDIADPDAPRLLADHDLGGFDYQPDPHQLLYWAPAKLMFVPIYGGSAGSVVSVTRVESDALVQTFALTHSKRPGTDDSTVQRVAVVGPRIWTVSQRGVLVSTLAAGKDVTWMPFP